MVAWSDLKPAQQIVMRAAYQHGAVENGLWTEEGERKQNAQVIKSLIRRGLLTDAHELTKEGSLLIPVSARSELRPINQHMANITNPAQAWALKIKRLQTGDALMGNWYDFRICRCATKGYLSVYVVRCLGADYFKEFIFDEYAARRELITWLMARGLSAEDAHYVRDDPVALALSGIPTAEQLELPDLTAPEVVTPGKVRDRRAKAVKTPEFVQMRLMDVA